MTVQHAPEPVPLQERPVDLLSSLYRNIGISAVAAALESSARRQQKPAPIRTMDLPAILRSEESA
jgi:hypothetical protein